MSNTSTVKPFLDYQSQIKHLKEKNLIIPNEIYAIKTLKKTGYYSLINGYKDIFKDSATNNFYPGTTFDDIYRLYLFDAALRAVFLKYILLLEKHVKSSISYHFTTLYGNGISSYQDINNYEYGNNLADVQYLFRKMNGKIKGQDVPLWVLATDLTLGETAGMYRYLKGRCKTLVCNDFHHIKHNDLGKMLIILTKYRNICAHGNRLFNARIQDSIPDLPAHKKLRIPQTNSRYNQGKSDLFASVISLKYLLDASDFRLFYYDLKKIIKKFSPSDKTLELMGFPQNWMSILRIKVY